ncbi:MAG: HD domain-containing protein, partial [Deltaproteobacteria bacterium]|nr:HD domain-containing protein [Deltaproteobacteria bacterium]
MTPSDLAGGACKTNRKRFAEPPAVRIPSVAECGRIMKSSGMMPNIRRHSFLVARVAKALAEALNEKGACLSIPLVVAGALLHDIAKTRSLREGGDHVEMGRRMVLEMGYPEVAWIVGHHVDSGPEIAGSIDEARVVNYSDKRVQHDRVVPLEDRLADLMVRYGKTPEKRARLEEMARNIKSLEREIFSRIRLSPGDLESMIRNSRPLFL